MVADIPVSEMVRLLKDASLYPSSTRDGSDWCNSTSSNNA